MLIHPSAATEEHFDVAAEVLAWADGELDQAEARARIAAGVRSLSAEGIRRQLAEAPEKWICWIQDFAKAAQVCYTELALPSRPRVPDASHWEEIAEIISNEVVPGTRLAVINSKEGADDRPDFEPQATTTGWGPPPNHSTIFVSGNVMARGLTLEGLTTTLFTRDSASPLADTQMQMQRWFGYRGSFIELCRVFLHPQQLELFARYHEADEALRRDILTAMETAGPASALTVLQGSSFAASGKLTNVSSSPLAPRATPFVRHMNDPEAPEERTNAELVATTFSETEVDVVRAQDGRDIGLIVANDLDLLSTAELLDQLRYSDHGPGGAGAESDRWNSVASHLGLTNSDPEFPLYRAPIVDNGVDLANDSPYWIAAYLRTWAACLTRRAVGLTTTDPPYGPWSLVDLERRAAGQPSFRIALRFGSGSAVTKGPLSKVGHTVRTMARQVTADNNLESAWGSRGASPDLIGDGKLLKRYPGDEYFDYFARGESIPTSSELGNARPVGQPGLLLFHPIERGRGRCSIALGMSVPVGGPDQVAARRSAVV